MRVAQECSGILQCHSGLFAGKRRAKETSSAPWEQTVPHLRGSPGPSLMHWERHDVAVAALAVAKICSCAESRRPTMHLAIAPGMLAAKVDERHGEAGMIEKLQEGEQLGRLRTRDPGGLHLDPLNESLVLGLVVLPSGLAGGCGRPGSAA